MAERAPLPSLTPKEQSALVDLVYRTFGHARFTQDSPLRPDVWLWLWEKLAAGIFDPQVDMIILPSDGVPAGHVAVAMEINLCDEPVKRTPKGLRKVRWKTRLSYSSSTVHAYLTFDEILRAVMPLTDWWGRISSTDPDHKTPPPHTSVPGVGQSLMKRIEGFQAQSASVIKDYTVDEAIKERKKTSFQLYRFVALASFTLHWQGKLRGAPSDQQAFERVKTEMMKLAESLTKPETKLIDVLPPMTEAIKRVLNFIDEGTRALFSPKDQSRNANKLVQEQLDLSRTRIRGLSVNRRAENTATLSRRTVKADAAERIFQIDTTGIHWAVIDSGIDATHAAFGGSASAEGVFRQMKTIDARRVVKSYDFNYIRELMAVASLPALSPDLPAGNREHLDAILAGDHINELSPARQKTFNNALADLSDEARKHQARWTAFCQWVLNKNSEAYERLQRRRAAGAPIDWTLVEPFIEIPYMPEYYRPPQHEHGTHVAGILAGHWPKAGSSREGSEFAEEGFIGVCPKLALYDIRAFDGEGQGREDTLIHALQFVEHLNRASPEPVIHGVNLSLAVGHDVQAYACGQTLVCQACNKLVRSGVVVVAAAGNKGYEGDPTQLSMGQNMRDISITDPGNADLVITVGSTHRDMPHTYGVSYFSSRGPTADGRMKPDLVAPGEKIIGPVPGRNTLKRLDGTSMAAPHVSAVAAMLMARYRELVGNPPRIKQILLASATDLGRLPSFQGAGALDALRALQSI